MSSLISISVKGKDGNYKSYTISVSNETNKFGQNVSMLSKRKRNVSKKNQEHILVMEKSFGLMGLLKPQKEMM